MPKAHDDIVFATNDLIKKTRLRHEKKIQRLEKEIRKKVEMNLIIQQVVIKLLYAYWNIVDVRNKKFNEMLPILQKLFNHLNAQAPTAEAYDTLALQLNTSFQKAFDRFSDLKDSFVLAPVFRPTISRHGEGLSEPWKTTSEYKLRDEDENSNDEV